MLQFPVKWTAPEAATHFKVTTFIKPGPISVISNLLEHTNLLTLFNFNSKVLLLIKIGLEIPTLVIAKTPIKYTLGV